MVAKSTLITGGICLLLVCRVPSIVAQQADQRPNVKVPRTTTKQNQGLIDFALQGANSTERDYGQCLDEGRRLLIQETVDRIYFWSNLLALGTAFALFILVIHQHQLLRRREQIAADALAQYHNARLRAEAQVEVATQRNHALMSALSELSPPDNAAETAATVATGGRSSPRKERVQQARSTGSISPTASTAATVVPAREKPSLPAAMSASDAIAASIAPPRTTRDGAKPVDQMGLFGADVDLIAKVNSLQQQLNSSQEREKHLRRQLNDSEVRLQKEQQKTRNLQG